MIQLRFSLFNGPGRLMRPGVVNKSRKLESVVGGPNALGVIREIGGIGGIAVEIRVRFFSGSQPPASSARSTAKWPIIPSA